MREEDFDPPFRYRHGACKRRCALIFPPRSSSASGAIAKGFRLSARPGYIGLPAGSVWSENKEKLLRKRWGNAILSCSVALSEVDFFGVPYSPSFWLSASSGVDAHIPPPAPRRTERREAHKSVCP
jgi:hypothetical protein